MALRRLRRHISAASDATMASDDLAEGLTAMLGADAADQDAEALWGAFAETQVDTQIPAELGPPPAQLIDSPFEDAQYIDSGDSLPSAQPDVGMNSDLSQPDIGAQLGSQPAPIGTQSGGSLAA